MTDEVRVAGGELVLSATSVGAYQSCGWRFYLQYVEAHPGQQSPEASVGLAVHAGAEAYYRARLAGAEHEVETGLDAYELSFVLETLQIEDLDPKLRQIGRRVMQSYIEDVGATVEPVLVEQGGTMTVNGILYSYHIDLVDSHDVVRDTKVLKARPRDPGDYGFAMTGYSLAFREETGREESDRQLDVMVRLKRDRPYHLPIKLGPASDAEIASFAGALERTADGIAAGRFKPNGLPGACPWCPVRNVCDYYAALSEERTHAKSASEWNDATADAGA